MTGTDTNDHIVAVDDISFLNCEKRYTPPGKWVLIQMLIVDVWICRRRLEKNPGPLCAKVLVLFLAPSSCSCSFEDGLCVWVQGAEGRAEWLSGSGPTETPNTGPGGDHTTGKGKLQ